MTRINTNLSSLKAQKTLQDTYAQMSKALTRLSTGLRINTGKDDPAGMLAAEILHSEIVSTNQAIANCERANGMVATADSALSEVSTLLNEIRGLVTEAANGATMSPSQLSANQLQIDSSLEAIDRIAQMTKFQGQNLLDGSLEFVTDGVDESKLMEVVIDQANFQGRTEIPVDIYVRQQATKAALHYNYRAVATDTTLQISGAKGSDVFAFGAGATVEEMANSINLISDATGVEAVVERGATEGRLSVSSPGVDNDLEFMADTAGSEPGNITLRFSPGSYRDTYVAYTPADGDDPAIVDVQLQTEQYRSAAATQLDCDTAVNNNALDFSAAIPGSLFDNASVNLVDAVRSDGTGGVTPGGYGGAVQLDFRHDPTAATAVIEGFGGNPNNYLKLEATAPGADRNNAAIQIVDGITPGIIGAGQSQATWDDTANLLTIYVDPGNTTYDTMLQAINDEGTFQTWDPASPPDPDWTNLVAADPVVAGDLALTGNTSYSGGDANTLFVRISPGVHSAQDVVDQFDLSTPPSAGNTRAAALFDVVSSQDNDGSGLMAAAEFRGQLTGGTSGGVSIATAQEVAEAVNTRADVQDLLDATIASGDHGLAAVSPFEEVAYYGDPADGTGIQFLGPDSSRRIQFVSNPGEALSVDFTTTPDEEDFSKATLPAVNANAATVFTAADTGEALDDMIVRLKTAPAGVAEGWVTYDPAPSRAQLLVDAGAFGGDDMLVTAVEPGELANDVDVRITHDNTLAAGTATATYDRDSKVLTLAVADNTVDTNTVIAAINSEGTFRAEREYTDDNANPGTTVFDTVAIDAAQTAGTNSLGQLAEGGHQGGVLEFTLLPGTDAATMQQLLNNDNIASQYFRASNYPGSDGTGIIDVRRDSQQAISRGGLEEEGVMTVHLETDEDGVVQTTAADLVSYFESLSAEQTRGVSASLWYEESLDQLDPITAGLGQGRLAATTTQNERGEIVPDFVEFTSDGRETVERAASGRMVAVNGIDASFTVTALNVGEDYNDVTLQYRQAAVPGEIGTVQYSEGNPGHVITVTVDADGSLGAITTANDIENWIEADPITGPLFQVDQLGTGLGDVTLSDDSLVLEGGLQEVTTERGAHLLGASDDEETGLTLQATEYGSDPFVSVEVVTDTPFTLTDTSGRVTNRVHGTDLDLLINDVPAVGRGLEAYVNTSFLDMTVVVSEDVEDNQALTFRITDGGALFQIGADMVSTDQARMAIADVSTARLGGEKGYLAELRTGGGKDLWSDPRGAAKVLEEVTELVTLMRGRLGSFQKQTLETNIGQLSDTVEFMAATESEIRDADYAKETSELTRTQILAQSGVQVLGISNNMARQVLSLLSRQ